MKDEYKWILTEVPDELKREYRKLLPRIRKAARGLGYAIGLHGSMKRDLDLIAVPWIPKAATPEELIRAIQLSVSKCYEQNPKRVKRAHGRCAYVLRVGRHAYIDISIMPMTTATH